MQWSGLHKAGYVTLATVWLTGCAGTHVAASARQVRQMTREAREAGAYGCAPRELALAEVHTELAERELSQGDYFRAREHLQIADENARSALRLSPRDRCAARAAAIDTDADGVPDGADKCPTAREDADQFEDADGCPEPDNDRDKIEDLVDRCPLEPEDNDGFEDGDGCPDPDNDRDDIEDRIDKCPAEAEDKDGHEDQDGCPDPDNDGDAVSDAEDKCPLEAGARDAGGCPKGYEHIVVGPSKIELKQKIFFQTSKAVIDPRSYGLLSEIARALLSRPSMRVRIEGHTDSRGNRALNVQLSQARAEAVRQHLVGLGIDGGRLEAQGFGPDQPIETNKTAAGREKNRRVEFVIIAPVTDETR